MRKGKEYCFVRISILVLAWVAWIICVGMHIKNYAYLYPVHTVTDGRLAGMILRLVAPVIPLILCSFLVASKKKSIYIIGMIVFCVLLCLSFIFGAGEMLYAPVFHSYTADTEDFGVYDSRVEEFLEANPVEHFPEEIPEQAENVQYCYFYESASCETIYIAVSWSCGESDYNEMAFKFSQYTADAQTSGETVYYFPQDYDPNGSVRPYFVNAVFFDESQQRVSFVVSNDQENFPASKDEVFSNKTENASAF